MGTPRLSFAARNGDDGSMATPVPSRGEIRVIDTTLRDAHQSLWATRMRTAHMLPVIDKFDRVGYESVDLMGAIQFDVCVRYLKEDPWERVRRVHAGAP